MRNNHKKYSDRTRGYYSDVSEYLTDDQIKELWVEFEDISVNPETECLEEPFFIFETGDHREKVWKWFDKHYSKGVYTLLYGE